MKRSRNSNLDWSNSYFKDTSEGQFECTLCGHCYKDRNASNFKRHLASTHRIDGPQRERGQKKLEVAQARETEQVRFIRFVCTNDIPLSIVEDPFLRDWHQPPIRSRATLRICIQELARKEFKEQLKLLRGSYVTLAYDSGTIWDRYLSVVAVTPNGPLLTTLVSDKEIGGALTTENITKKIHSVIDTLKENNIHVSALVADNANNMQGVGPNIAFASHQMFSAYIGAGDRRNCIPAKDSRCTQKGC